MAMNPEVKQLLLDALKSGEYNKTTGRLARKDEETGEVGYCCLGVLCEVGVKNGVGQPFQAIDEEEEGSYLAIPSKDGDPFNVATCYLPDDVGQWAELDMEQQNRLAQINDEVDNFGPVIQYIQDVL